MTPTAAAVSRWCGRISDQSSASGYSGAPVNYQLSRAIYDR